MQAHPMGSVRGGWPPGHHPLTHLHSGEQPKTTAEEDRWVGFPAWDIHLWDLWSDAFHQWLQASAEEFESSRAGQSSGDGPWSTVAMTFIPTILHCSMATFLACPSRSASVFPSSAFQGGPMPGSTQCRGSPGDHLCLRLWSSGWQRAPEPGFGPQPTNPWPGPSCTQCPLALFSWVTDNEKLTFHTL